MEGFYLFIEAMNGNREVLYSYGIEVGRDLFEDWFMETQYGNSSPRHYRGGTLGIKNEVTACLKKRLDYFVYANTIATVKELRGEIFWLDFLRPLLNRPKVRSLYQTTSFTPEYLSNH